MSAVQAPQRLTIPEWRERARQGLRKAVFTSMFHDDLDGPRVRVKRVWPNRIEVVFLDAQPADEFGPAAPAGRIESVHPGYLLPLPGLW